MSDFNSSLPVRTEQDGDVVVKVADSTLPSQQLKVNSDGSVNITDNNGSLTVDATDLDIRDLDAGQDSVEVLQPSADNLNANANLQVGDVDVSNSNPVPISDSGGSLTVDATDLDIRNLVFADDKVDVSGSDISIVNGANTMAVNTDGSINVVIQEDPGLEIVDYNTEASIAAGATSQHDVVFAAASKLHQVFASASGKLKIEVQVETGASTNLFNTILVAFNSTAAPNIQLNLSKYAAIPAGARVRIIRMNKDTQAQDVYSTVVALT